PPPPPTVTTPPAPPIPPRVEAERQERRARLSLTKRASAKVVRAGRTVKYRLTTRNRGGAVATNVRVCDTLPAGTTLVSRGGGRLRGGKVCWTVKRLAPGKSVTRTLTLRIDRDARSGKVVNRATAAAKGVRTARASRSVRVERVAPKAVRGSYVTG
ncbi:DUF11 domain-containing protein, partial [Patulibacter sp. S7RM1-6]